MPRTIAETCLEHDECVVIRHIEDRAVASVLVDAATEEYRDVELTNFEAWRSHAHRATHVACRIGDTTGQCEDHTTAPAGELLDAPPVIPWAPMCANCHTHFGHHPTPHRDGIVITDGAVEAHNGATHTDCAICVPRAQACVGCQTELAGTYTAPR